jgi:hypothetical protein
MQSKSYLTTGEIARLLGVPGWAARRAIDALGEDVPRAGLYRLLPQGLLPRLREKLEEDGYLPRKETSHVS